MRIKTLLNDFLALWFPNGCTICHTPLVQGEDQICLSCLNKLAFFRMDDEANPAAALFAGQSRVISAHALLAYQKGNCTQKLIFNLKYYQNKKLGLTLGRMGARLLKQLAETSPPDLLVPVPLHKTRLRARGYNQSEWIAKGISAAWGTPVDTSHLKRTKKTKTQTRKSLYERLNALNTSFQLDNPKDFEGKHILLIDDVVTSGATLNACIEVLSGCKDIRISIFCLSIAV